VVCASGCTVPRRSIGQQCEIDSDCQAPLVCGFGRCRRACDVDRDCVPPAYCVVDPETGLGSCALDDELRCALDSDCAEGLVCRLGTCTTACADDRDCPPGTRCNRTQGETPFCEAAASKGCLYDGDCPDGLVCGADRRCRYECFLSSECAGGGRCVDNRCVVPDGGTTPAVDAGPARCRSDAQCDDGTFCNGAERCRPGAVGADDFGCAPPDGPACPADTTCDEAIDGCVSACDQDGDGHARPGACGGDDCDDADGSVHPGVPDDCNYRDDDCDGMEDEDVDRSSDPRHCGLCGNDCAAPNATGRCVDSVCVLEACLPGYADLDGRRTNGCEHLCDPAAPDPCNGADDDCDGAIDEDPPTDSCSTVNATPSCVEGACALTCDDGFEDCNGDVRDGCEADFGEPRTCGSCNARCGAALACTPSGCESAAVRAIAAGGRTCCALRDHGRLACWGENVASSFGGGPYGLHGAPRAGAAGPFEAVALGLRGGMASGCALDASGAVWCWGSNEYGQAGVDPASSTLVSAPSIVSGASSAQAVGVGAFHVCALTAAGTVQCWGNDTAGELGQGSASSEPQPLPQDVPGLSGVVGLGVGRAHTCAVVAGGEVRCWGDNQSDQSGATCGRECVSPTAIAGLTGAVEVAAGSFFSCARLGTGEVFCWGNNGYGQLGAGIPDLTSTTPVAVSGIDDAVQLALGGNFACALSSGGGVSCWGEDRAGQLGDGTVGGERDVPAPVVGLPTGVVEIAAGWEHACARTTDGEVWCWGRGADGQLGDEGFDRSATPVRARYLP
jgi:alpha-tubulin suppressor-like RCC1 family protein